MSNKSNNQTISKKEVSKDVDLILWSFKLSSIYRFTNRRFWERETVEHEHAMRVEGYDLKGNKVPRAESVADHSWHLCEISIIIAPRFGELNLEKCLLHATLHDILEIITDDKNPIGKNGQGTNTHAFNKLKKEQKILAEQDALNTYLTKVNEESLKIQKRILEESISLLSPESKFIKAIDRMHPLIYILKKKKGNLLDEHLNFTIRYASTCKNIYPPIEPYFNEILLRLLRDVSTYRKLKLSDLKRKFNVEQLNLFGEF